MSDEQVVKLLEEIRDLQKEFLANQRVGLQNQEASIQNQQVSLQNIRESAARREKATELNRVTYIVMIVLALVFAANLFVPFLSRLFTWMVRR